MNVLVIGGGGYVGSVLVPKLVEEGHAVTVIDLFIYMPKIFDDSTGVKKIKEDVRNVDALRPHIKDIECIIHLACISNDPSLDLEPDLGKSSNFDSFEPMVYMAKNMGVRSFIYASSSSVYGIKDEARVNEGLSLEPLTDYSKFKYRESFSINIVQRF